MDKFTVLQKLDRSALVEFAGDGAVSAISLLCPVVDADDAAQRIGRSGALWPDAPWHYRSLAGERPQHDDFSRPGLLR